MPKSDEGQRIQYYCKTCGRTMSGIEFYTSHRVDKYPPDGKMPECKKCLTRHVNNWDPDTYLWILEEIDVPYAPWVWNDLMVKYAQDPLKVTGNTILGRYLSQMKLVQFKDYRWADTEKIQQKHDEEIVGVLRRMDMTEEQIEKEVARSKSIQVAKPQMTAEDFTVVPPPATLPTDPSLPPQPIQLGGKDYFEDNLTEEDRRYLSLKWGKEYKPQEWVQMEQLYQDMCDAFTIDSPAHIDNLKLYCKSSLKSHQLIAIGDVDGFQKMSKTCDMLMKSGNWAAAQNKEKDTSAFDAVGQLVALAEKEGPIPRFYIAQPNDKVDETLQDMNNYTNRLVREELNLGNLIENALRAMVQETSREEDKEIVDMDNITPLDDKDYVEYTDELEDQATTDAQNLQELIYEDEENGAK